MENELPKPKKAFSVFKKMFNKKAKTKEIVVGLQIDQTHAELVGSLCVDINGNVEFLPLKDSSIQVTHNVESVLQVGLKY